MNWRFTHGVEQQTKAFIDGFSEVIPLEWLQIFDEKELEVSTKILSVSFNFVSHISSYSSSFSFFQVMLCGIREIDVDEWEKNTLYSNYTCETRQIQWFWKVL